MEIMEGGAAGLGDAFEWKGGIGVPEAQAAGGYV